MEVEPLVALVGDVVVPVGRPEVVVVLDGPVVDWAALVAPPAGVSVVHPANATTLAASAAVANGAIRSR